MEIMSTTTTLKVCGSAIIKHMNKKVIISGVSGQDGSFMAEYLLKNTDYEIIGAMRRTSQAITSNITECLTNSRFCVLPMDLTDVHSITNLIQKVQPDYFINLGGQTYVADSWNSPQNYFLTNTISVIHILEAIRKFVPNCRVYSAGSSEQMGNVIYSPQDECHPFRPRSPYAASKCATHHLIKVYRESYGLYAVHGILYNHESFRRQEYFVTRKITKGIVRIKREIQLGEEVVPIQLGNVSVFRDWSDAEDVVDAIWKMVNQEMYNSNLKYSSRVEVVSNLKDYVVSSGISHSVKEFVHKAFSIAGLQGLWEFNGLNERYRYNDGHSNYIFVKINPSFYRPAEVESLLGDSTLIRRELGWKPKTTFDQLIRKMVNNDLKRILPK